MSGSDPRRLSVSLIEVVEGREADFRALASAFETVMTAKKFGTTEIVPDEASPQRFYAVRYWATAESAALCHGDPDVQAIASQIDLIARVTHLVNGVRKTDPMRQPIDEHRTWFEADRRFGFDRRTRNVGSPTGVERRSGRDRRDAPRHGRDEAAGASPLVEAARRARDFAEAAYSKFKVGAALECADGTVVTGCNIENATYGLTVCAERVAIFKALSEGHRAFTRIAVVADTASPTPPCGACRQILWEFGGDLEVELANLTEHKGRHRLRDLLPLPFDARLL